jgi:hypothetical protein
LNRVYIGFVIISLITLFITFSYNNKNNSNIAYGQKIFTPSDNPYNKTFAEWAHQWWIWHLSIPDIKDNVRNSHPRENYSPEKCSWNQNNGSVWFLADGKDRSDITQPEIRECTVPQGKALMVQIVGSGCSTGEGFKTEKDLLDCAIWILPTADFSASVDGTEVINTNKNPSDREKFYVEPFKTKLSYVKNNIYGVNPGTYDGMVAGYYLFVPPLAVGKHQIEFKESDIKFSNGIPVDKRLSHVVYSLNIIR